MDGNDYECRYTSSKYNIMSSIKKYDFFEMKEILYGRIIKIGSRPLISVLVLITMAKPCILARVIFLQTENGGKQVYLDGF